MYFHNKMFYFTSHIVWRKQLPSENYVLSTSIATEALFDRNQNNSKFATEVADADTLNKEPYQQLRVQDIIMQHMCQ